MLYEVTNRWNVEQASTIFTIGSIKETDVDHEGRIMVFCRNKYQESLARRILLANDCLIRAYDWDGSNTIHQTNWQQIPTEMLVFIAMNGEEITKPQNTVANLLAGLTNRSAISNTEPPF